MFYNGSYYLITSNILKLIRGYQLSLHFILALQIRVLLHKITPATRYLHLDFPSSSNLLKTALIKRENPRTNVLYFKAVCKRESADMLNLFCTAPKLFSYEQLLQRNIWPLGNSQRVSHMHPSMAPWWCCFLGLRSMSQKQLSSFSRMSVNMIYGLHSTKSEHIEREI